MVGIVPLQLSALGNPMSGSVRRRACLTRSYAGDQLAAVLWSTEKTGPIPWLYLQLSSILLRNLLLFSFLPSDWPQAFLQLREVYVLRVFVEEK